MPFVTYAPPGEGPFPLALIHHGSTGSGIRPSDFDRTSDETQIAKAAFSYLLLYHLIN